MEISEPPTRRKKLSQNKRRTEQRRRAFEEQKRNPGLYVPIPVGRQKKKKKVCGRSLLESTWVSEKSSENSEPTPGISLHVPEFPSLEREIAPILLVPEIPSPDREIALNLLVPEIPSPDREICGLDEALRLLDAVLTPVKPFTSKEASPGIPTTGIASIYKPLLSLTHLRHHLQSPFSPLSGQAPRKSSTLPKTSDPSGNGFRPSGAIPT